MRPPKRLARSVTSAIRSVAVAGAVVVTILTAVVSGQTSVRDVLVIAPEHPAIEYWTRAPDNPVSWLATRLQRGEAGLEFRNDGSGYLLSLLRQLDINPDSLTEQGSRGVYFSDDVAISRADTGAFEIIATDPWLGAAFYTVAAGLVAPRGRRCLPVPVSAPSATTRQRRSACPVCSAASRRRPPSRYPTRLRC